MCGPGHLAPHNHPCLGVSPLNLSEVGTVDSVMGSEFESYTAWLVEEVRSFAEVRTREAELYPEDLKLSRSSMAQTTLATNLGELPPDHPKIQELWWLWLGTEQRPLRAGNIKNLDLIKIVADELKQYGYDGADEGDPEPFLNALHCELELLLYGAFAEPE